MDDLKDSFSKRIPSWVWTGVLNLLLAGVYFGSAKLGQLVSIPPGNITAIWIPSGICLFVICVAGPRLLPGVFIGAFAGNIWSYFDSSSQELVIRALFSGSVNGLGDLLCTYIGYYVCKKAIKEGGILGSFQHFRSFLVFAVFIGPGVSALLGVTSLYLSGFIEPSQYLFSLVTWWTGDSVGVLLITPFLYIFWSRRKEAINFCKEVVLYYSVLVVAILLILDIWAVYPEIKVTLFIICPLFIWPIYRFDSRIVMSAIIFIATCALVATGLQIGPFSGKEITTQLVELQFFLAVLSITIYIMLILDAERKKALVEMAIEKEKAEESEKLKSAFLANMSHEIRTPLNAIMGFSSLLLKKEKANQKNREFLKIIHDGGTRLLHIITDVLDLSELESNKRVVTIAPVNLNDLLEAQFESRKIEVEQKQIAFNCNFLLPHDDAFILTDGIHLNRIIDILIDNSIKFTEEGEIEIGYTVKESQLLLYVKDTGMGIVSGNIDLIFERFNKIEYKYSVQNPGAGLGLSIAKKLVGLLGGEIWIDSVENKGSTFYVSIPFKRKEISSDTLENSAIRDGKPYQNTILIVEDEETNRAFLKEVFGELSFTLLFAKNGKEGIDIFENNHVDVIIMDIKMPILDGYDTSKEIWKINASIPIIAYTAFAVKEEKERLLNSGFIDIIFKPSSIEDIVQAVTRVIRSN